MNCFGIFDNSNVETRRTSKTGKRGEAARRASSIALSCMLGFTMLISPVTVRAEGGSAEIAEQFSQLHISWRDRWSFGLR